MVVAGCYRINLESVAATRRATSADRRKTSCSGLLELDSKVPVFQLDTRSVGLQCCNKHLDSSCRTTPMLEQARQVHACY
jgi:hypothetical protein